MRPFALAVLLAAAVPALQAQETAIRWVDSRPMLHATLRAGEKSYICHLLLDLSLRQPLLLHRNAAGSLRAEAADVRLGEIELSGVAFTGQRDRLLERLTAEFATELAEVPVAGYLGLAAFGDRVLVIDGPNARLRVLPAAANGQDDPVEAPRASGPLDLAGDPAGGAIVRVMVGDERTAKFALHTREPGSFVASGLAHSLSAPTGELPRAGLGKLDLAPVTPFRVVDQANGVDGGIGGAVLRQMVVRIELGARRVLFDHTAPAPYPEAEAALCRALVAGDDAMLELVRTSPAPGTRHEAALLVLARELGRSAPRIPAVQSCCEALLATAPASKRATVATGLLEQLPFAPPWLGVREGLVQAVLGSAKQDLDGTAQGKLRLELGRIRFARGETDTAYRDLLAAAFALPQSGEPSLWLGKYHEARNELERARARYFQALLDMEHTGTEGLAALQRLHRQQHGSEKGLAHGLQELGEGRLPALHPIPRDPDAIRPTGKAVLLELFTGAQCGPCAAADVAVDALLEHYRPDEIAVVVWHLPIPAPEPMISAAARARAALYGVRGTPTLVLDGVHSVVGGGKADQAQAVFDRYDEPLRTSLQQAPTVQLAAECRRIGGRLRLTASATGELTDTRLHAVLVEPTLLFPGRNGILFHHQVARAMFSEEAGQVLTAGKPIELELDTTQVELELDASVAAVEKAGEPFTVRPTALSEELGVVVFVVRGKQVLQARTIPVGEERAQGR